jgi:uncharacterized membrane protein
VGKNSTVVENIVHILVSRIAAMVRAAPIVPLVKIKWTLASAEMTLPGHFPRSLLVPVVLIGDIISSIEIAFMNQIRDPTNSNDAERFGFVAKLTLLRQNGYNCVSASRTSRYPACKRGHLSSSTPPVTILNLCHAEP